MRVLIVHEHQTAPGLGGGGAESLLRDLMAALKGLGHEVAWFNGRGDVRRAIDSFKPDVVQLQTLHNFVPDWLGLARTVQASGTAHVWAVMDYWPFCAGRMLLTHSTYGESCSAVADICDGKCACGRSPAEWLAVVNASPVVAYNRYTAEIYRRNGLRCDYVVELGVDTELFKPDPAKRDKETSVYTSSAWPEFPVKGMDVLRAALKGTGIQGNLLAHITREQVAEGLKRAHIYVFPSIYQETWGLSLTEAMASGCACIASDVAGARAQAHGGERATPCRPRDAQALRDKIEWLLADDRARQLLGEWARAHVEQEHSLEAMGRRWEAVYREVIANGS